MQFAGGGVGSENSYDIGTSRIVVTKRTRTAFSAIGFEPIIWLGALLWLGFSEPQSHSDFTLCPLRNIGISGCPGCGLGRSVSYALHGHFSESFQMHFAGMPAVLILLFRVFSLFKNATRNRGGYNHFTIKQRNPYG